MTTQTLETVSLDEIDLSDHDAFVERVPHEWFTTLRHEAPVFFNPEQDGPGFYAITRYEDIRAVHRDWQTFSSEKGGTSLEDLDEEALEARKSMIDMDPPRHDELRGLIARRFTKRAVRVWEDDIRKITNEVLDAALPKGEFDFVREVSSEIPMLVFAQILGVPKEDRRHIIELGDRLLGNKDPEFALPSDDSHRLLPFSSPAALDMFEYGRKLAAERRKEPRDDIITQLAFEPLTQREYDVFFVLLATAGNETTRHTITHGLIALTEFPDQLERLRKHPELIETAADEILRWATAVHHFRRTTTREVEMHGVKIPEGAKITTWFTSGNRDETVFENPHTFDVGRSPNKHMTFGPGGIHHCMGAHLAKLEVQIVFQELLRRVHSWEIIGKPERLRSNFFNAVKRLHVRMEGE